MELHEIPLKVCADIGVDGPVNLFALLAQTAQRFPDRGAVHHGERRCCSWQELRDRALHLAGLVGYPRSGMEGIARFKRPKRYLTVDQLPKNSYGKVLKRELRQQLATHRSD